MKELLKELGLADSDIKVYLFLIDNGPSIAGEIAKKTGIHRRNTYDALERLIQKGFISYIKDNNITQFEANNPELILEKLNTRVKEWTETIPKIKEKIKSWETKKETLFYRGINGIKNVFFDQIKENKEILVLATNTDVNLTLKYFFPKYQLLRKENNIKTRMIFDTNFKKTNDAKKINEIPLSKIKYLSNYNSTKTSTYVYGDNVATIKWTKEPFAILIRDKEIAKSKKEIFELLWNLQ